MESSSCIADADQGVSRTESLFGREVGSRRVCPAETQDVQASNSSSSEWGCKDCHMQACRLQTGCLSCTTISGSNDVDAQPSFDLWLL